MSHVLTERTYVNADGTKVVPGDSSEAHSLLGLEGDEVDDERAKALGLAKSSKAAASETPKPAAGGTPKRPELTARAKELGIPATGTNAKLAAAIAKAEKAAGEEMANPPGSGGLTITKLPVAGTDSPPADKAK